MAPDELEKYNQEQSYIRKKELAAKFKINSEISETIKLETDVNYKEAANMVEQEAQ